MKPNDHLGDLCINLSSNLPYRTKNTNYRYKSERTEEKMNIDSANLIIQVKVSGTNDLLDNITTELHKKWGIHRFEEVRTIHNKLTKLYFDDPWDHLIAIEAIEQLQAIKPLQPLLVTVLNERLNFYTQNCPRWKVVGHVKRKSRSYNTRKNVISKLEELIAMLKEEGHDT